MKKSVLILLFLFICLLCSAQNTINGNLKKHVYTLASDSLKGRPMSSTYSKMALNYIYKELEYTAPTIQDDAMVFEYENQKSRNLYITLEGNDPILKNEVIYLTSCYTGNGFDSVQGHELIKYSTYKAISTASLIEITKLLKARQKELKRTVIISFTEASESHLKRSLADNTLLVFNFVSQCYDYFPLSKKLKINSNISGVCNYFINHSKDEEYILTLGSKNNKLNNPSVHNKPSIEIKIKSDDYKYEDYKKRINWNKEEEQTRLLFNVIFDCDTSSIQSLTDDKPLKMKKHYYSDNSTSHYFGIEGLLGLSKAAYWKGTTTGKMDFSYNINLFSAIKLKYDYFIKVGLGFTSQHLQLKEGKGEIKSISMPISFMKLTEDGDKPFFTYDIGLYFDWNTDINTPNNDFKTSDFNKFDAGLQFGLGVGVYPLKLAIHYRYGLLNKMKHNVNHNGYISTRGIYCSIGLIF